MGCHPTTKARPEAEGQPEVEDARRPRAGQRRMLHGDGTCMVAEGWTGREVRPQCRRHHMWRMPRNREAAGEQVCLARSERRQA